MSYASDALIDALTRENDQLSAENAKLRDERDRMYKANVEKNGEILRLLEESAKLRELCANMLHDAMENVCSKSYWCDEKNWRTCNDKSCGSYLYVEMARELGVEVDE